MGNEIGKRQQPARWLANWLQGLVRKPPVARAVQSLPTSHPALVQQVIPESEVSDVALAWVLDQGLVSYQPGEEDISHCRTLGGMRFSLCERQSLRMLQLWAILPCHWPDRRDDYLAAAARINDEMALVRAAVDAAGDVVIDTFVSYAGGLLPMHLLHTIALQERLLARALLSLPQGEG